MALARTASILRAATADHPRVLRVLFYGQSISTPRWTERAVEELRSAYPNVAFDTRNLAIGGFDAEKLQWTVERDVREFYPDLIVFHVFGDHHAYEKIIRTFRSWTTADIVVSTDHVIEPVEPLCDAGFHLRLSAAPGCKGVLWFRQNSWTEYMSGVWIPAMARKYGLAVEPRREGWSAYLQRLALQPEQLLADSVHPNEAGWALMSHLFVAWFLQAVAERDPQILPDSPQVVSLPLPQPGIPARYAFTGNRLELLSSSPLQGFVRVRIDGRAQQETDGCWLDSRTTPLPAEQDWPAIRQVRVDPSYHRADTWTLRITGLNAAQDRFRFSLSSELLGADGAGNSQSRFRSPSGRVGIDPQQWVLAAAVKNSGQGVPEGFSIQWHRSFVCGDEAAVTLPGGGSDQRYVIATNLANTSHVAEVELSPTAPEIHEIRAYRPMLLD
ncbi:MAG: hypothetical protein ABW278_00005 [Steroidobacteraceae bacterium]